MSRDLEKLSAEAVAERDKLKKELKALDQTVQECFQMKIDTLFSAPFGTLPSDKLVPYRSC